MRGMVPGMVLLLACSARKHPGRLRADSKYAGAIHCKGLEFARRERLVVQILSAKYGLLNADTVIDDYDQRMKGDYRGPWPTLPGFYLGGQDYFRHAPGHLVPLIPSGTIGFMLQNMNALLAGTERDNLIW